MKAFLVDLDAFTRLSAMPPTKPIEAPPSVFIGWQGLPVMRSSYIITHYDDDPPNIMRDFDRWFRTTRWRIEDRKEREKESRREQSLASAAL